MRIWECAEIVVTELFNYTVPGYFLLTTSCTNTRNSWIPIPEFGPRRVGEAMTGLPYMRFRPAIGHKQWPINGAFELEAMLL